MSTELPLETVLPQGSIASYRMSPQQRRLWRTQERRKLPNAQITMFFAGMADAGRLSDALAAAYRRHESLRTGFQQMPGMAFPLQVVNAAGIPAWRRIDLHHLPAQEQDRKALQLAETDRNSSFDLHHGPVVRPLLIDLNAQRHLIVLTLPAIATDRRSLRLLASEFAGLLSVPATDLDPEPLQYTQFADWQDELLESEDPH